MNSHLDRSKGDLDTITTILELSYQNLPPELKACFLCLGFFKEDAVIKAKELVHTWVAQGLVAQEVEGEEVARDHLNELIGRNMVQVKKMNEYDEVKGCQMHDLLRDLSIRKAKEEIDFEVVREEHNSSHQSLAKPRHRSIYCSGRRFFYSTNRNKHLRSLFVHYTNDWQLISGGPSSYWKSFELLRVLHFGRTEFKVLPKGIGELIGLRYLRMRVYGRGSRLPHSWAKLKNLEVLHITGEKGLFGRFGGIIIDKVILNMESLRHLYVHVYMLLKEDPMPILEKLPKLIYLELISYNEVGGRMVIARGGFPTLKVLHLRYFEYALKMEIEESAMPELNQFIYLYPIIK